MLTNKVYGGTWPFILIVVLVLLFGGFAVVETVFGAGSTIIEGFCNAGHPWCE